MSRLNYNRDEESPRRSILGRLVNCVVLIISIIASIALLLTLLFPFVDPSISWIFPVLGLVAPAVYITNLILALYWIIIWRWLYAIPMVAILLFGVSSISLFVNMEVSKDYGLDNHRNMVKVMSYNVRTFFNDQQQWSTEQVGEYIEEQNPDIICFQEYRRAAKGLAEHIDERLSKYNKAVFNMLAIYSRYPIIEKENIFAGDKDPSKRSMWVDVVVRNDTIRVFNNHLHSTYITANDEDYLKPQQLVKDTLRKDKLRNIISRFNNSSLERNKQIDTIAMVIANSPYRAVVCGDFNDTPMSRTYNVMSQGLKDAFQESGNGFSYTYRGFYNTLRIDYILVSDGLTPHNYISDEECIFSDHLPIMSYIKID